MVKSLEIKRGFSMIRCNALILILFLVLGSCAAPPKHKAYPVLEPMDPPGQVAEVVVNPRYEKLVHLLHSLGYEPVGMQFETDANLDLLYQIFSNSVAQQRKIKLVYTGLQMAYDKIAESLTVGGTTNIANILAYIQRNVAVNKAIVMPILPQQTKPVPSPTPVPILKPEPSPSPVPNPTIAPLQNAPALAPEEEIEIPVE